MRHRYVLRRSALSHNQTPASQQISQLCDGFETHVDFAANFGKLLCLVGSASAILQRLRFTSRVTVAVIAIAGTFGR